MIARVYLLETSLSFDKLYSYSVPEHLKVKAGDMVVVPFGPSDRRKSAYVVSVCEDGSAENVGGKVKPVLSVLGYGVASHEEVTALCLFIKERCFCTFGAALRLLLPPGVNTKSRVFYTANDSQSDDEIFCFVRANESVSEAEVVSSFGKEAKKRLDALCRSGLLTRRSEVKERQNSKRVLYAGLTDASFEARGEKQKLLIELLRGGEKSFPELGEQGVSPATVRSLESKGVVAVYAKTVERSPYDASAFSKKPYVLSESQRAAADRLIEKIREGKPAASLLYGITGSGKTKVIIEAVRFALENGKGAIVLLPEIGLTAQVLSLFFSEFGERCAVLHSMLSEGERADTYRKIERGEVSVVVGTRSAVFAPVKNLGIIVLDEEQEHTYKSDKTPKYHAKDIARFRAARHGALMLLSSATPSVESFYKAESGVYDLVCLKERFGGAKLPEVIIEDVRGDSRLLTGKLIGERLKSELDRVIENGEQAILFINRRGYNSHLSCRECGYAYTCPNCSVSLTYHAYDKSGTKRGKLACHYCGFVREKPLKCDRCGGEVGYFGFGTQMLQDELEELYGDGAALRMDMDTTSTKKSHDDILEEFRNGGASILYGTQMVAKGLDFPRVSLVGMVMADGALYMNDYRACERTFSLITQLVGRAGRADKKGKAIIQTYNPKHEVVRLGSAQDYNEFYKGEAALRKQVVFPPFCSIAAFNISAEEEKAVTEKAKELSKAFEKLTQDEFSDVAAIKIGPFKEGIYRIGGRYREKLIIKYKDSRRCRELFMKLLTECAGRNSKGAALIDIDVNPTTV